MNEENNNHSAPEEKNGGLISTLKPATAAFIALVGIFIAYQVGGAILTFLILGLDFQKADVNQVRLLTMGGQILLMLLPTLIFARYVYPVHTTKMLRVHFPQLKEIGLFTIGMIIFMPLLQAYISLQNTFLDFLAQHSAVLKKVMNMLNELDKIIEQTYGDLLKASSVFEASFVVFVVAVIPAICEEFLFRGMVQKSFEQKFKPYFAIFITSLFFGLYHFNPYGLVALIALGFYFGYAAYKSDSIFVPMALHFFNNFFAVISFFILGSEELLGKKIKHEGSVVPELIVLIFTSLLFYGFIVYINKYYEKRQQKKETENDLSGM